MQLGDIQLGKPAVLYKNTKANIEALSGIAQGAIAYATDTDELGTYDGVSAWTWSAGGGGGGAWGSITGTLSSQTDLQTALDGKQAADSDLTTIAGLTPSNDDILQRKAGAWTNRTLAQLITDLALGSFAFISTLAHSALTGIGTNTHAQIDTFIGTTAPATYAPIAKGVSNGDGHDHAGGDGAVLSFLFPFATYIDLNPITATGKFPYAGTAEASMSFVSWSIAAYTNGAAHSVTNYYTITMKLRQSVPGSDVTLASLNTQTLGSATQKVLSTSSFSPSSMTGTGYIYLEVTKTGTPADTYFTCPAFRCKLT